MANRDRSFGINVLAVSKGLEQVGRGVERLGRTLEEFDRKTAKATVDVDTRAAEAKVGKFARDLQSKVERAVRSLPEIQLNADSSAVDRRIAEIRRELASLSSKRIGIDVDAGQAQAQINRLSSELARLSGRSANVQVRADTAAASAALLGVASLARRIDGQNVAISVNANDVSRAISLLGLLTAGLAGVSAAVLPAAAALAALPALGGAAAQGIVALGAGFSGVGDAVKALQQEETKAAAGTAASASSRVNSAQAIASAQRQVERAVLQADRAAIQGAQQVADARRAVSDAYADAARQVEQAERNLANAQRTARTAQEDLTRARRDAREELEDLNRSVEGAALSERRAQLALLEARQAMDEARANAARPMDDPDRQVVDDLEWERLKLAVDEAGHSLAEARDRYGDVRQEAAEANRAGVEGSQRVVSAQRTATDATQGVRDAERELAQARTDGARQVTAAQEQLARAQQQASWAQQDAAASVADAQRALANAYADAGTAGSTAMNKVKEAMEGLSPEAQRFAKFLSSEVIPGLHGIRDAVQATLLPRMETALRNLGTMAPVVSAGLAETGRVLGDLAVKGSEMMSSGPWRADFATIMAANNRILGDFGTSGLSLADAFRSITVSSLPMVERFSQFTEQAAQAFDSFITGARVTGELDAFFQQMGDTLAELGHIAGQIITGVFQLTQAMGPLGMILLKTVGNLVELIGNLAAAHPLLTQLAGAALVGVAAFNAIGKAVAGMTLAAGVAAGGWTTLLGVFGKLAPSAIAQTATMQRVAAGLNAAELAAGRYTDRLFTSTAAAERAYSTGARLGTAVTRIASALPVAGLAAAGLAIAYDALTVSADEAAKVMLKGGDASSAMVAKMTTQGAAAEGLANSNIFLVSAIARLAPGLEEARAKADQMFAAMTPLQQAQTLAAQSANAYGDAVKAHGPNSAQAAAAADVLALSTDRVEQEQRQAEQATKTLTDRLVELQNQMLGSVNADLAAQASKLAVERAQRSYTDAVNQGGAASLGAREAEVQYQQALTSSVAAAGEAARAQHAHKDAAIQDQMALKAQNDEIWRLVTAAGSNAPPALLAMARGMSDADLKARGATVSVDHLGRRIVSMPGGPGKPPFTVTIGAHTGPAQAELDRFVRAANNRKAVVQILGQMAGQWGPPPPRRAMGGPIRGPGTTTSDSILARLSNNEHVWSAREVAGAGGHHRVAHLRSAAAEGQLPRFAGGGAVRGIPGFAAGGMAGDSVGGNSARDPDRGKPGFVQAEDGSWVGPDYYRDVAGASSKAADAFNSRFSPALETQRTAGEDLATTLQRLTAALPTLTQATTTSGRQIQATWMANTAAVTTAQQQQTAQQQTLGANLAGATAWMGNTVAALQARHNASWADMRARSGAEIGTITGPIFGGLHHGMDAVQRHSADMAGWVGGQYARLRGLTADPIRWSLDLPINRGLVPAWNAIDRFFALNRPMGPVPVGFSSGGKVSGTGSGDTVPALLTPGEFVVKKQIAEPTRHFLAALNSGQAEAIQAAGGKFARMAEGGPIQNAMRVAKSMNRTPYVWGGNSRAGTDCSGAAAFTTRALRMEANPYRRIGTTASFPWPGFAPGMKSAFAVGNVPGSHMRATLSGMNIESGGAHGYFAAGPPAKGVPYGSNYYLPQAGGRFVPGGGGGFDTEAYLRKEFANTRKMIAEIVPRFGPGNPPTATTRLGNDAVAGAHRSASAFDGGGLAMNSGWMFKRTVRPERVLDPRTTAAFEELVRILGTLRGQMPVRVAPSGPYTPPGIGNTPPLATVLSAGIEQAAAKAVADALNGAGLRIEDDGRGGLATIVTRQQRAKGRRG